jgi:Mg2+/citrate symporter
MDTAKVMSYLGNSLILATAYFQYRGKLNWVFPIALLASLSFLVYGILEEDMSFIISNSFFLIINLAGTYKWTFKKGGKDHDSIG